jgi:hypothetical protein
MPLQKEQFMPRSETKRYSLDDIVINDELRNRAARMRDKEETDALIALTGAMSSSPLSVLQILADSALKICRADSSGVSILETLPGGEQIFRWRATAGKYAKYLNGTMPRHLSPCGAVLDRDSFQLMAKPVRYYAEIAKLDDPIHEVLLAPFYYRGKAVGTLWVVTHRPERHFDSEDTRLVLSLCKFASEATDTLVNLNAL